MAGSQQSGMVDTVGVFSLLEFAESQLCTTGTFKISLEALCSRIGVSQVDAYRTLYQNQTEISGYIPEYFDLENMSLLAQFLSRLSGGEAESMFQTAGAYLSSSDLSELAALYYDTAVNAIAGHTPQKEVYCQMYTRFKTHRRAFDVYIDYFFDIDHIFDDTVTAFLSGQGYTLPHLGRVSTRRGLSLLLERHVISISAVFGNLYDILTGENRREEGVNDPSRHPALRILGLNNPPKNKRELRLHYKTLMKTYHPDVNPDGLEMSKKINAAYAELISTGDLF